MVSVAQRGLALDQSLGVPGVIVKEPVMALLYRISCFHAQMTGTAPGYR